MFIFFLHLGTIRVKGVLMEGNCTTVQQKQTELCTRCGAVNEPSEGTHFFLDRDGRLVSLLSLNSMGALGMGSAQVTGRWE